MLHNVDDWLLGDTYAEGAFDGGPKMEGQPPDWLEQRRCACSQGGRGKHWSLSKRRRGDLLTPFFYSVSPRLDNSWIP